MIWTSLSRYRDFGLLILRVGLGIFFILHGWPKLLGGPERWEELGNAMGNLGVTFFPVLWGFLAMAAELLGGLLLILGFLFRPACLLLFFTMIIATLYLLPGGDLSQWSHPAKMAVVFAALLFIGPGRFSLDKN